LNLLFEELVEIGITCSLSNEKLFKEGINDLLKKLLIEKIRIIFIFAQINDISINLVTHINLLENIFPKGHIVFQALPPFTLWL
jgi:hypothetical protein